MGISITILRAVLQDTGGSGKAQTWACDLEVSNDDPVHGGSWYLPATAPGDLAREALPGHFEARVDELWRVAARKQYPPEAHVAAAAVRAADIKAIAQAAENATTVEALRVQVVRLVQVVDHLVQAQGIRLTSELGPPRQEPLAREG